MRGGEQNKMKRGTEEGREKQNTGIEEPIIGEMGTEERERAKVTG